MSFKEATLRMRTVGSWSQREGLYRTLAAADAGKAGVKKE